MNKFVQDFFTRFYALIFTTRDDASPWFALASFGKTSFFSISTFTEYTPRCKGKVELNKAREDTRETGIPLRVVPQWYYFHRENEQGEHLRNNILVFDWNEYDTEFLSATVYCALRYKTLERNFCTIDVRMFNQVCWRSAKFDHKFEILLRYLTWWIEVSLT